MNYLIVIYQFIVKHWNRVMQAVGLVSDLGKELSEELKQADQPDQTGQPDQPEETKS